MAKVKSSRLRGAVRALAQVKGIYLHDFVVKHGFPPGWVKPPTRATAQELDDVGIGVKVHEDTYDFGHYKGDDVFTCVDVLEQWRLEALEALESKAVKVTTLARTCGTTRQALYKLVGGGRSPQHYFTIRGRSPFLLWQGKPLEGEFDRCLSDLEAWNLTGSLV